MRAIVWKHKHTNVYHDMKKNTCKHAFICVVIYPDHNNPQKNSTDALPDYPHWTLVSLTVRYGMPYCLDHS